MKPQQAKTTGVGQKLNGRLPRLLISSALSMMLFGTIATAASATTYCVASAPNCSGTAESTLEAALTAAGTDTTGSDTIVLPAATMSDASGFYYGGRVPLEIDGQGQTSSILTAPGGDSNIEIFDADSQDAAPVTLNGLGLEIPASSSGVTGFWTNTSTATIENVAVTSTGAISVSEGLELGSGGAISNSTVQVPTTGTVEDFAVELEGSSVVQDSTMVGRDGLQVSDATSLILHRVVAMGAKTGAAVEIDGNDAAQIDDSLLIADQGAKALYANGTSQVTCRQLTIAGDSQSTGIELVDYASAASMVTLSDSIVADPLLHGFFIQQDGSGAASIVTDHDDYDHSGLPSGFSPGPGDLPSYVAPVFANPSNGDYRLLASSPSALFAADSTVREAGESTTDLDGMPRFNGALRDLGAYQHQAPTVSANTGATSLTAGAAASFTATGDTVVPNDPLTYKWSFDDGQSASGATVSHAFAIAGTHTATVTVTDALGFTATATASVAVTAAPAPAAAEPSGAFTLSGSGAAKTGVVTLRLGTHASGTVTIKSSFSELVKLTTGKGKHRRTRRVRRSVSYAHVITAQVGSGDALSLKLKPSAAALKHLHAVKHEKVTVTAQFTPTGGQATTRSITVSV